MTNPNPAQRFTANSLIGGSCVLAVLYFGREVLEPVTLAGILSLVAAPLVSRLQRSGLSRLQATLATLLVTASCVAGTIAALATQLVSVGNELPQYRAALHQKATQLRTAADNLLVLAGDALSTVNPHMPSAGAAAPESRPLPQPLPAAAAEAGGGDALTHVAKLAWEPLGKAGLVLVLLMFILLEHESLQDRLVRLGRKTEISRTIRALADAAQGVSRFFLSQFVINGAFGIAVGTGLWALSIPHPLLWGTCSAVMRFVPYLGALAAGAAIACFAAAIDPGWGLVLSVVIMYGAMELVLSNVIEPKVYGRSTGLSPLAVVLSALFWGTIW
ncbi:MAG TPA: AI-2E family transporter, partial [Pseudoduganella sp.]